MALDFSILTQVPTFGERFMAGRQAAQEEAQRNMLLQQRQMEFQQAQDDRRRKLEQESKFDQMADLIRENGLDPDDPKVLGQFAQAAMAARQPQLVSFVTSMAERAAKRRQALVEAEAVRGAMREPGEEPVAPAGVVSAPPVVAPAMAAAPELSQLAVEQAEYARPRGFAQGQFVGGAPTAVAMPVGEYPTEATPRNALAPQPSAPANAMVAPAAQAAAPAARAAAPDVARMEDELERLQTRYDRVAALGTEAARKQAALLKPEIDRLLRRIERASKVTERESPLMRDVVAFGFPPTAEGLAKFEAAKRDPDTAGAKEYNLAVRQGFKGSLLDFKTELAKAGRATVEVKLPPQEGAFETGLGRGQSERILKDQEVAQDARSIIDTVQQGRQLLRSGMITGFGAEALTQIGAALNQAGISFASDSVANTQAFAANMAQNVGRIIKQFGAGTGLSNADREYAEKMAGGKITLDRAAIERILDINERAARNVITAHNKRVAGVKTNVPLTVELPPAMPTAPAAAPAGRPSLQQIFQQPAGR